MRGIIEVESDNIPVFYLKELKNLYVQQMKYDGYAEEYEHSTQFKEKILKRIAELTEHKMGRDVVLTLKGNCGKAIFEACNLQDDGMCLERERVARIIRKEMLSTQDEKKLSNKNDVISKEKFSSQSEIDSLSPSVMIFINMLLHGSNVDTSDKKQSSSALTIAQLSQFNTAKQKNKIKSNETLLTLYVSLIVHSRTRKKSLIEELNEYGLSISYKRILEIQSSITNQLWKLYNVQRSVCPSRFQENIFTVSAIDNLDHNPSSSTAKDSFHGTGISIFHFQTNQDDSFKFELSKTSRNNDSSPSLPSYYTNVKPTKSTPSTPRICAINSMNPMDVDHFDESKYWFNYIHDHLDDEEMLHR